MNTHNVSATISIRKYEWDEVGDWMWKNRKYYNGLSVLPYDGGTYVQAPFETITRLQYDQMIAGLEEIDLTKVIETDDNTDLQGEIACAGGVCGYRNQFRIGRIGSKEKIKILDRKSESKESEKHGNEKKENSRI